MNLEKIRDLHITKVAVNNALLNDKMTLDDAKAYVTEAAVDTTPVADETPAKEVIDETPAKEVIDETPAKEVIDETPEEVEQGIELPTDEDVEE